MDLQGSWSQGRECPNVSSGLFNNATLATTAEELTTQCEAARATDGPTVVAAVVGRGIG